MTVPFPNSPVLFADATRGADEKKRAAMAAGLTFRLGLVAGIFVPLAYVAPLLVGMGYRITREAHAEIRRQVAAQRLSSFGHDPDPPAAPPTTANTPLAEGTTP